MAVIRVGVQSPAGGAGQLVDLDGPSARIASITNVSGESIQYSLDGGTNWVTLAASESGGSGLIAAGQVRLRKVSSGAYPAPVDIDATIGGLVDEAPLTVRILKATTGALQLTGGTAGVKTTLLTVALPDGWLSDPTVRLVIEYAANYTNSANVKNYGIDIGSTAGTAVALRTQAPTTTASETTLLVVQRSTTTPARFWIAVPNNARVFGTAAGAGSTAGVLASASIDPAATGQNLYFWAQINPNTEQITFETIYVKLEKAEG